MRGLPSKFGRRSGPCQIIALQEQLPSVACQILWVAGPPLGLPKDPQALLLRLKVALQRLLCTSLWLRLELRPATLLPHAEACLSLASAPWLLPPLLCPLRLPCTTWHDVPRSPALLYASHSPFALSSICWALLHSFAPALPTALAAAGGTLEEDKDLIRQEGKHLRVCELCVVGVKCRW